MNLLARSLSLNRPESLQARVAGEQGVAARGRAAAAGGARPDRRRGARLRARP